MHGSTRSSTTSGGTEPPSPPEPRLRVVVLAGGIGSRFWPVSTPSRPKQLLPLGSDRPLIVDTIARARLLEPEAGVRVLTGREMVEPIRSVLPDLEETDFQVEPRARGTAPALAWATWSLFREDPDAVLLSLHSDHVVGDPDTFAELLRAGAELAGSEDLLLTVGAPPDRPETGYGYIRTGEAVAGWEEASAHEVEAFVEKPDRDTAERYLREGYLWNTGIFLWRAGVFLAEVERHAPELHRALRHLERSDVEAFFDEAPKISVDEAILERSDRVATLKAAFPWDDVGSWQALSRTREADADGNVRAGEVHVVDGERNIVFAEDGPVVLFGVSDLVAIRTRGVTLVTDRARAPRLKELLDRLPPSLHDPEV